MIVGLLLLANTINFGADLGAMAAALKLLVGGPANLYVVGFAVGCTWLEVFSPYERYVSILKWGSFVLLAYVAVALVVPVPWKVVFYSTFVPSFSLQTGLRRHRGRGARDDDHALLFLLAILARGGGRARRSHRARTHRRAGAGAGRDLAHALRHLHRDGLFERDQPCSSSSPTAATLNAHGVTDIQTSAQAAEALRPIAGVFTFALFAAGIIGIGLLAVPVLAASGAYALGEALGWTTGLDRKPLDAKAFYVTIAISTLIGVGINFVGLDPIKALFWSAVINGVVAVPLMVIIMLMAMREDVMGDFVLPRALWAMGWLSTATMAVVVAIMFATW